VVVVELIVVLLKMVEQVAQAVAQQVVVMFHQEQVAQEQHLQYKDLMVQVMLVQHLTTAVAVVVLALLDWEQQLLVEQLEVMV
jgi:hypothetical protein